MKKISTITAIILLFIVGMFFLQKNQQQTPINKIKTVVHPFNHSKNDTLTTTPTLTETKKILERKKNLQVNTSNWLTSANEISFPILMYHSLSSGNSLRVPPAEFEAHLQWLKDNGYYTLTPEEAYHVLNENKKPAEKNRLDCLR